MQHVRQLLASRHQMMGIAVICLVLLAYVDWITGPSVSVTCFYLVPVFMLSWYGGWRSGILVAIIHAVVWLAIDRHWNTDHTPAKLGWNFAVRFITIAGVAWLVQICRNLSGEIERLVEERTRTLQREVEERAANEAAIRRLADELSVAEDSERRRLAHELHDALGQSLSLLKLRLESLASTDCDGSLRDPLDILTSVIQQARTLTFELYPSMLDQLGLPETLRHYTRQLSSHIRTPIEVSDSGPAVEVPVALNCFLFRAAKELISNSLKHGQAKEIIVQVRRGSGRIRLVVSDDGKGFHPDAPPGVGLGLPWIRERIRCLGGTSQLETAPGHGTRIVVEVPATIVGDELERRVDGQIIAG